MKNIIENLINLQQQINQELSLLATEQLQYKINTKTWSIAEILAHIIVVNESYYPTFQALQDGKHQKPWLGKFGFWVSFLGKLILKAVEPQRIKKIKTFKIWEPENFKIDQNILTKFNNHQQELIGKIKLLTQQVDLKTVIASPANANIIYRLETALNIIVAHEQRHWNQIKEILTFINK